MNGSCKPCSKWVQGVPPINDPKLPGPSRRLDQHEGDFSMSFKKITTSAAVVASLLATSLSPLTTAANAGNGWNKHKGYNYSRSYDAPRYDNGPHYYNGPRYRYAKRHRHGNDVAKGLAIGLGVLAVGAIIAHGR